MKRHIVRSIALCSLLALPFCFAQAATPNYGQLANSLAHDTNLSPKAIEMAFAGYKWALKTQNVRNKEIITIVDFTVPSNKERLYVVNLNTGKIMLALAVSHGKNSSGFDPKWATKFSNSNSSLQSSVGTFLTRDTYFGKHGYSLKVNGLEASNSNALKRNVVVHSANYVSPEYIKKNGRAGASWGCFAVSPDQNKKLIKFIENGSILYAYGQSTQNIASTKVVKDKSA